MKKFLIALAVSLATVMAVGTTDLHAQKVQGVVHYNDGSFLLFYDNEEGGTIYWKYYETKWVNGEDHGSVLVAEGHTNPNPEGGEEGEKGDEKSRLNLILQQGGEIDMTPDLAKTPLGKYLISKGVGIIPAYQPSDDESGGPSTGMRESTFVDKLEQNKAKVPHGYLSDVPYEPNSGSVQEYLKSKLGKGPKPETEGDDKGDDDGKDDKLGTDSGVLHGDLPGPPELVNPNPVARTAAPLTPRITRPTTSVAPRATTTAPRTVRPSTAAPVRTAPRIKASP